MDNFKNKLPWLLLHVERYHDDGCSSKEKWAEAGRYSNLRYHTVCQAWNEANFLLTKLTKWSSSLKRFNIQFDVDLSMSHDVEKMRGKYVQSNLIPTTAVRTMHATEVG